jgi:hypothetical protein
MTAQFFTVAKI